VPAIHIRHVPEPLLSALRERAAANGRSLQQEVLTILEAAIAAPVPRQVDGPTQLVTVRTSTDATWRRDDIYDDEGR
jgi:plasmid stability protein